MKRFGLILAAAILVVGCAPAHHNKFAAYVREYQQSTDDGYLYWYILNSSVNGADSTYYYSSPTRVPTSSFSAVSFSKAASGKLPDEVEKAVSEGKEIADEQIEQTNLPENVGEDVAAQEAAYQEYSETQGQIDQANGASENPAPAESSSDSGGGDSGGDGGGSD